MRYSRRTLLLFGAGLLLGLAVVSADLRKIGWLASLMMAAGLALLPPALVADWWSHRPWRKPARKRRAPARRQSNSSPPRRRGARGK
jgi:hypothetical protein